MKKTALTLAVSFVAVACGNRNQAPNNSAPIGGGAPHLPPAPQYPMPNQPPVGGGFPQTGPQGYENGPLPDGFDDQYNPQLDQSQLQSQQQILQQGQMGPYMGSQQMGQMAPFYAPQQLVQGYQPGPYQHPIPQSWYQPGQAYSQVWPVPVLQGSLPLVNVTRFDQQTFPYGFLPQVMPVFAQRRLSGSWRLLSLGQRVRLDVQGDEFVLTLAGQFGWDAFGPQGPQNAFVEVVHGRVFTLPGKKLVFVPFRWSCGNALGGRGLRAFQAFTMDYRVSNQMLLLSNFNLNGGFFSQLQALSGLPSRMDGVYVRENLFFRPRQNLALGCFTMPQQTLAPLGLLGQPNLLTPVIPSQFVPALNRNSNQNLNNNVNVNSNPSVGGIGQGGVNVNNGQQLQTTNIIVNNNTVVNNGNGNVTNIGSDGSQSN